MDEEQRKKYDQHIADLPNGDKEITLSDDSKVVMREPTVGDQLVATKGAESAAESEIRYVANLTMKTENDIKSLKMKDYSRLQAALKGFLS